MSHDYPPFSIASGLCPGTGEEHLQLCTGRQWPCGHWLADVFDAQGISATKDDSSAWLLDGPDARTVVDKTTRTLAAGTARLGSTVNVMPAIRVAPCHAHNPPKNHVQVHTGRVSMCWHWLANVLYAQGIRPARSDAFRALFAETQDEPVGWMAEQNAASAVVADMTRAVAAGHIDSGPAARTQLIRWRKEAGLPGNIPELSSFGLEGSL